MYDCIIVGGGSAGCVLANRLTEDTNCRVLLLEAGGEDDSPLIHTPGAYGRLQDSKFDWAFRTVPQQHLGGRRIFHPRGKVLGGSSSINYMMYVRGHKHDYDRWANLGSNSWGYSEVLDYFIRAERNEDIDDRYHGGSGPLVVASHRERSPLAEMFVAAARAIGLPFNPDFNGAEQEGCGYYQATLTEGARCSTAVAYLRPARARPNLTVVTQAHATRIRVERGRAVGVDYVTPGGFEQETAAEIVLAAGAVASPQLLLLSGIGPTQELPEAGVSPIHDLPGVGKNLQDHISGRVRCEITAPLTFPGLSAEQKLAAQEEYERTKGGPLAGNFLEAGAFVRSDPEEEIPDLQLIVAGLLSPSYPEAVVPEQHGITLSAYVTRPRSRGEIRLASADPLDRPMIDPNYLHDPSDVKATIAGVRWNREIIRHEAFRAVGVSEVSPGPGVESDEQIEAYLRASASTAWHLAGTCKMGVDDVAVVDPALKVRGIDGLRVVDASIMPTLVGGNTYAPTVMIAEKGADLIRAG